MHINEKFNETEIIENCQKGNLDQFGLLYDEYIEKIYNFIYFKTFHKEVAEDLTSLTFTKALKNLNKFKDDNFSAWLYRIARNTVIDHYRTKKENSNIDDVWDISSLEEIEVDVHNKIQLEEVQKYLNKLKSEQREIVVLKLWQGLSYSEISKIVGKSEGACKMNFLRTLEKLRNEMPMPIYLFLITKLII